MDVHFSKNKDEWQTPLEFFNVMNRQFLYDVDVAADAENHQCPIWLGPGGLRENALEGIWKTSCIGRTFAWCNPPYSASKHFINKAIEQMYHQNVHTTMLIPARTDTKYFHEMIWPHAQMIVFLKGRLTFGGAKHAAPFPSMIVIFDEGYYGRPHVTTWDWRLDPFPLKPLRG